MTNEQQEKADLSQGEVKNEMQIKEIVKQIQPVSEKWREKARERLANLIIPQGSLGDLLALA